MTITDTTKATAKMLIWIMEFKRHDMYTSPELWDSWSEGKINEAINDGLFVGISDKIKKLVCDSLVLFCLGQPSQFDKLMTI